MIRNFSQIFIIIKLSAKALNADTTETASVFWLGMSSPDKSAGCQTASNSLVINYSYCFWTASLYNGEKIYNAVNYHVWRTAADGMFAFTLTSMVVKGWESGCYEDT